MAEYIYDTPEGARKRRMGLIHRGFALSTTFFDNNDTKVYEYHRHNTIHYVVLRSPGIRPATRRRPRPPVAAPVTHEAFPEWYPWRAATRTLVDFANLYMGEQFSSASERGTQPWAEQIDVPHAGRSSTNGMRTTKDGAMSAVGA